MPQLSQWEPIYLEWMDPNGIDSGWVKLGKKDRMIEGAKSVGMVESQDDDRVTIILCYDHVNKHVNGGITIPNVCITRLVRLDPDGTKIG